MYKIVFDDGNIKMLVATEMETMEECEEIVARQEKPECYKIIEMSRLEKYQNRLASGEKAADIMTDMENEFNIPMLNDEDYNKKNADVIELYREVADSRNF